MSPKGEKGAGGRPKKSEEEKRYLLPYCRVSKQTLDGLMERKKINENIGRVVDRAYEALAEKESHQQ